MLPGERLSARGFAIRDRIDNTAMLIDGDVEQFPRFRRYVLTPDKCAGRRKRKRTDVLHRALQHPALRQAQDFSMKPGVQVDVLLQTLQRQLSPPVWLQLPLIHGRHLRSL